MYRARVNVYHVSLPYHEKNKNKIKQITHCQKLMTYCSVYHKQKTS